MAEVVWLRRAVTNLSEIAAYIALDNPVATTATRRRLQQLGDSLASLPRRGRPAAGGARELVSTQPYVIRYRVSDDGQTVTILAVRHTRRRPL